MRGILHFLSYHNAVPITLGILFLGAGGVFAATNPELIYDTEETVLSIDNTYIVQKDLTQYTPEVQIQEVTEDEQFYYVGYLFTTVALEDSVWQDVSIQKSMKVSKAELGGVQDLGVYVTAQLRQLIDRELAYLREVQQFEQKQLSNKVVATAYSGLVGAMLNDSTEVIAGYRPVVTPPERSSGQVASVGASSNTSPTQSSQQGGPGAPRIQILGKNPALIPLGARYADLGAVVTDDKDVNLGLKTFVNGREVRVISLDTSTTTEHAVVYKAEDTDGNKTEVTRKIIVYDPSKPMPEVKQVQIVPQESTQQKTNSNASSGSTTSSSDNQITSQQETTTTTSTTTNTANQSETTSTTTPPLETTTVEEAQSTATSTATTTPAVTSDEPPVEEIENTATTTEPAANPTPPEDTSSATTTATTTSET